MKTNYLKMMLKPYYYMKALCFLLSNIVLVRLTLPVIAVNANKNLSLGPADKSDIGDISRIYKATLGDGKDLSLFPKLLLKTCGKRLAFKLCIDAETVGYVFVYFHFFEFLKYMRVHGASAAILPEYRKGSNGLYLYFRTWDWFKNNTCIKGFSSRYRLSNTPVRMLHKAYGFNEEKYYNADGEEWCYAVCEFNRQDRQAGDDK